MELKASGKFPIFPPKPEQKLQRVKRLSLIFLLIPFFAEAQMLFSSGSDSEKATIEAARNYVQKYRYLARKVSLNYGVPEAIVLAIAGLETSWGRSELALKANNHFGIKAKEGWMGAIFHKETEEYSFARGWEKRKDAFRSYASIEKSYDDFGIYMRLRGLYDELFKLSADDYIAWAIQLQKAGYASDQNYATKLIRIIEMYGLHAQPTNASEQQGIFLNKW